MIDRKKLIDLIEAIQVMILEHETYGGDESLVSELYEALNEHQEKLKQLDELTGGNNE